jgi:DNA-binding NarL/FixJ family response regulator
VSTTVPQPEGPAGLLISRDLIFTSKVVGTAQALGYRVICAGNVALVETHLNAWKPVVVLVDLSAGEPASPQAIRSYRALAPDITFLAFGSHVETDILQAAKEAGCDPVLPRSRFSQELPNLLRGYFEG